MRLLLDQNFPKPPGFATQQGRAVGEALEEARCAVRDYLDLAKRDDLYARLERVQRQVGE